MGLREYIRLRELTLAEFAAQLGRSETTVVRWLNGTRKPRHDDMLEVYRVTEGAVTPDDLVLKGRV